MSSLYKQSNSLTGTTGMVFGGGGGGGGDDDSATIRFDGDRRDKNGDKMCSYTNLKTNEKIEYNAGGSHNASCYPMREAYAPDGKGGINRMISGPDWGHEFDQPSGFFSRFSAPSELRKK